MGEIQLKEVTKEPWQMTREIYATDMAEKSYRNSSLLSGKSIEDYKKGWRIMHRDRVGAAIEEGKPVPAEVLADYPDLVKAKQVVEAEAKAEGKEG